MADYAATMSLSQARSLSPPSSDEEEHSPRSVPPLGPITTISHRFGAVAAVGGGAVGGVGGEMIVSSTPNTFLRKPRGRPLGSKNRPKPPVVITRESDSAMKPVVLHIGIGADVVEMVVQYARRRRLCATVVGCYGSISDVMLRHVTLRGPFNIISLTGTILGPSSPSLSSSCAGFGITLAGAQGQVFGGMVAGKVVASSEVVVVLSTYVTPTFHRFPGTGTRVNDGQRGEARHVIMSDGCSTSGMSMSVYGVAAPAVPLNRQISSPDNVIPWGPTSRTSHPY